MHAFLTSMLRHLPGEDDEEQIVKKKCTRKTAIALNVGRVTRINSIMILMWTFKFTMCINKHSFSQKTQYAMRQKIICVQKRM